MGDIAKATNKDMNSIVELLTIMHGESRYKAFDLNMEKLRQFVSFMLNDDDCLVLTMYDGEKVTGLFMANIQEMYFSECKTASDSTFYVHPEYRGSGIATEMVGHYIDWALSKNADDIAISTSSGISNSAVGKIADKFGMKKLGESYRLNYV